MSYNIVENGKLKNVTGPSDTAIVEGKPIYGERKQYDTNKKMPLAGQASLKYTIDREGILTGSCHKKGSGYTAWLHMNGKILTVFDNYGGESCSFNFPSVRVKAGDVIELTTNIPTTETTNFFWLNNIGITPIIGVDYGDDIELGGIKYINTPITDCNLAPINTVCEWNSNTLNTPFKQGTDGGYALGQVQTVNNGSSQYFTQIANTIGGGRSFTRFKKPDQDWTKWVEVTNCYSTNETVIGTWIDGKSIYRKVLTLDISAVGGYNIDVASSNIAQITTFKGIFNDTQYNYMFPVPDYGGEETRFYLSYNMTGKLIHYETGTRYGAKGKLIVTIEYTKTTD